MSDRPEHERCIRREGRQAYCGRTIEPFEWTFLELEHARLNEKLLGRLTTCEACRSAATATR